MFAYADCNLMLYLYKTEYSEKLSPDLEDLNKKWASNMNKIPKSEKEDLK